MQVVFYWWEERGLNKLYNRFTRWVDSSVYYGIYRLANNDDSKILALLLQAHTKVIDIEPRTRCLKQTWKKLQA